MLLGFWGTGGFLSAFFLIGVSVRCMADGEAGVRLCGEGGKRETLLHKWNENTEDFISITIGFRKSTSKMYRKLKVQYHTQHRHSSGLLFILIHMLSLLSANLTFTTT
jgi:hypothetical protein